MGVLLIPCGCEICSETDEQAAKSYKCVGCGGKVLNSRFNLHIVRGVTFASDGKPWNTFHGQAECQKCASIYDYILEGTIA